jgi:trigger factor
LLGFLNFWWEHLMIDPTQPEETGPAAPEEAAAVPPPTEVATIEEPAEPPAEEEAGQKPTRLNQTVELKDVGPCKKHIKVTVERNDIDTLLDKKYSELVVDANVAGFRPGKAPRRIIERRYQKDVTDQVKAEVLLASLEQLAEENDVAPLAPPDINPSKIEIPKAGPLVYEFEVEVRPQFDLPNYKGIKIRREIRQFTDEEVAQEERRILGPYGQLVPKPEGNAQIGDYLVTDLTTRYQDHVLGTHKEITVRVDPRLALKDGFCENFGEAVKGANAGDSRTVEITMSDAVADPALRGIKVRAVFDIKEIKTVRLPELTHEFLHNFGVHSEEQLRERIRVLLERRHEYNVRQSARVQVLQQIAAAPTWELPQDLLQRQARRAISRRIMEMRSAGMSEHDIQVRHRLLQQDILRSTEESLKEHFVLQKIAEVEKIEVNEEDLDNEIERIAVQNDESPRRVRARLEKEDLLEALAAELIERKALDLILDSAEYEDVTAGKQADEGAVATVEEQIVPGQMKDPTAVPPTPPAEETPPPANPT